MHIQEEKTQEKDTGWDCCKCAESLLVMDEDRYTNQLERVRCVFKLAKHECLSKHLISSNKDAPERTKIFSLEEVEQATNKLGQNCILRLINILWPSASPICSPKKGSRTDSQKKK